jgi:NADH pyrophosphatase NudC (nudix superfamily)
MKFCPQCRSELIKALVDSVERLRCSSKACSYVHWDNPTPIVAAIVEYENNDVVLARNRSWPEGMFSIITGFLERGETPEQCVVREVKEELGLDGTIEEFIGYYSFFDMNQLILAFHVKGAGTIRLGQELAEYKLVPKDKLKPWSYGTGHAIRDWLESN